MQKKLGGERGYLALKDLRIKSKFLRSNMPIHEVGRSGERKNPRGRRKKRKKARTGRLGPGLNGRDLGARNYGVELGARVTGAELPAMSPTEPKSSAPTSLAPTRVSSAPASMAPS